MAKKILLKPKNKSQPEQTNKPPFTLEDNGDISSGDKVWLSLHKTIQLKDFHPFGVTAGAITTIKEDETASEALNRISPDLLNKITTLLKLEKEKQKR